MARFQGLFFGKNKFFENQASLKGFIFVVTEYDNLTSVKTYRDRLRNLGDALLDRKFKFLVLERVKDLIEDSDAVRSLPFILLFAPPMSLRNFSRFCSRLPFQVFTLEFHSFSFFDCPIMHLKIHPEQVNGLSRILAEEKRQQPVDYKKISQGKNSSVQVSMFNQNGLFRYVM